MTSSERPRRGRGRPSAPTGAREAILAAALHQFADHGYQGASIRAIATEAGVESSLVGHHFGTKQQLFATTITDEFQLSRRIRPALDGDPSTVGGRFTRAYLEMWEDPGPRPMLAAIVRSAMTESGRFTETLRGVQKTILPTDRLPDTGLSDDGIELAAVLLLGVAAGRHIIDLPPVNTIDLNVLIDTLTPTVQRLITNGLPAGQVQSAGGAKPQ